MTEDMKKEYNALFKQIEGVFNAKKLTRLRNLLLGNAKNIMNLTNIFVRKALLQKEVYDYDNTLTNEHFQLLEQKPIEHDKAEKVLYRRLESLIRSLEYLGENITFHINQLSHEYLSNIIKSVEYFSFNIKDHGLSNINSRALSEVTSAIFRSDKVASKVIINNMKLIHSNNNTILNILNEIRKYNEFYNKKVFRTSVFPFLPPNLDIKYFNTNTQTFIKEVEQILNKDYPLLKYKKNILKEIIFECFSMSDEKFLENVKSAFFSADEKKKIEARMYSEREKIFLIIKTLTRTKKLLDTLYGCLSQNVALLRRTNKDKSSGIMGILRKIFAPSEEKEENTFFHIEYLNPNSKRIEKDVINIDDFINEIKNKIDILSQLMNKQSALYKKIKTRTNEAIFSFIEKIYFDILLIKERVSGVSIEIRLQLPRKMRSYLRDFSVSFDSLNTVLAQLGEQRRKYIFEVESRDRHLKK